MECPPIPQSSLDYLLMSKTYLKEHIPSTHCKEGIFIAGGCGETGSTLQAANYTGLLCYILFALLCACCGVQY